MTTNPHGSNPSAADGAEPTTNDGAFVVGGGSVGRDVAARLTDAGTPVTVVDREPLTHPPPGQACRQVDGFDAASLTTVDFGDATTAFILEPDDAANLLLAQLAKTRFGVDRVVVLVNDPDRAPAYDTLDVETVDAADAVARAVVDQW